MCVCASIRLCYVLPKQFFSLNVTYVNANNKKYLDIKYVCDFNRSYCFCLIVKCPQCLLYNLYNREKYIEFVLYWNFQIALPLWNLWQSELSSSFSDILFSAKWVMFPILLDQNAKGKASTSSVFVTDVCFLSFCHNSVMYWDLIWDLKMGKSHHSVINPSLNWMNQ